MRPTRDHGVGDGTNLVKHAQEGEIFLRARLMVRRGALKSPPLTGVRHGEYRSRFSRRSFHGGEQRHRLGSYRPDGLRPRHAFPPGSRNRLHGSGLGSDPIRSAEYTQASDGRDVSSEARRKRQRRCLAVRIVWQTNPLRGGGWAGTWASRGPGIRPGDRESTPASWLAAYGANSFCVQRTSRHERGAALGMAEILHDQSLNKFVGIGNIMAVVPQNGTCRTMVSQKGIVGHHVRRITNFSIPGPLSRCW